MSTLFFNFLSLCFILCNEEDRILVVSKGRKIGEQLREIREFRGKSQEQIGRDLHLIAKLGKIVNKATISRDEAGKMVIPPGRLRAYSKLYGIPYEKIVMELVDEKYGVDFSKNLNVEVVECKHNGQYRDLYERVEMIVTHNRCRLLKTHLAVIEEEYPELKKVSSK